MNPIRKRKIKEAIIRLVNDEVRLSRIGYDSEDEREELERKTQRHREKIDLLLNSEEEYYVPRKV